jgi:ribosomal protein S18 acetylase RimI-like enzyme
MSIKIVLHRDRTIPATQLLRLYQHVGWWPERTITETELMLNSSLAVGAWDNDNLIGFCRAVTDGHYRAYIEDVVVHENYRNLGIGKQLVSKLLDALRHIDIISLFCEHELKSFYEKTGFKQGKNQIVMHVKGQK